MTVMAKLFKTLYNEFSNSTLMMFLPTMADMLMRNLSTGMEEQLN